MYFFSKFYIVINTLIFIISNISDSPSELIEIQIMNNNNIFYAPMNIGSPNIQQMHLILDTQRSIVSLISSNCGRKCEGVTQFDSNLSATLEIKNSNFSLQMYKDEFRGRLCNDITTFYEMTSKFDFMLIDTVVYKEVVRFEGYLGLGFTKEKEKNYLYNLKSNNKIKHASFSLLMLGVENSYLFLGGYNKRLINQTDEEKIVYTNITYTSNDTFTPWYIPVNDVYINGNYSDQNHKVILSSSSNIIRIPNSFFFNNLPKIFNKKSQCQIWKDSLFHCRCGNDYRETFPTFTLTLNNEAKTNLTIAPTDYTVLDNSGMQTADASASCLLMLSPNYMNDYWILGTNFMNNFYLIFDIENDRIGFYDIKNFDYGDFGNIFILSMIVVCASVLFFTFLYCMYRKLANRRDALLAENNN